MTIRVLVFFFKQKTAYEMRISDWSSDVCSSDLPRPMRPTAIAAMAPDHRVRACFDSCVGMGVEPWMQACAWYEASRSAARHRWTCRKSRPAPDALQDRKRDVKGKSVSVRVDPGGRRSIKKKKTERSQL